MDHSIIPTIIEGRVLFQKNKNKYMKYCTHLVKRSNLRIKEIEIKMILSMKRIKKSVLLNQIDHTQNTIKSSLLKHKK
jgi:hypothetical protein